MEAGQAAGTLEAGQAEVPEQVQAAGQALQGLQGEVGGPLTLKEEGQEDRSEEEW